MASSKDDLESASGASSVQETLSGSSSSFSSLHPPLAKPSTASHSSSLPLPDSSSYAGSLGDLRADILAHFADLPPLFQGWIALRVGAQRWEERYCAIHPMHGIFTFETVETCEKWCTNPNISGADADASCIVPSLLNVRLEVEAQLNEEVSRITKGDYTLGLRLTETVVIATNDEAIAELAQAVNQSSHIRSYFETCVILRTLPVSSVLRALAQAQGPVRHRQFSIVDRLLSVDECAALSLLLSDKVEQLVLCHCGLAAPQVTALYTGCAHLSALKDLDLRENLLDTPALQLLSKALSVSASSSLTSLDLSNNPIGDSGAKVVASLLTLTPNLASLRLAQAGLSSVGARHIGLACARVPFLSFLDLSYNAVGGEGMTALCAAIKTLISLTKISLICADLADIDLSALRDALRVNLERSVVKGIAQVELQGNAFSAAAVLELLDAGPLAKRIKLGDADGDRAVVKRNVHAGGSVKVAILFSSAKAQPLTVPPAETVLRISFKSFLPDVLKLLPALADALHVRNGDLALAFRREAPPCVGIRLAAPLADRLIALQAAGDPTLTVLQVRAVELDRPGAEDSERLAKLEELQRELLERPISAEELLERSGVSRKFLCDELVASLRQTIVRAETVSREEAQTLLRTAQLLRGEVGERFSPFIREVVRTVAELEVAQLLLLKALVHALQGRVDAVLACFDSAKHAQGQPITAPTRFAFSDAVLQSTTVANQSATFVEIFNVEAAGIRVAPARRTKAFRLAALVADELGRRAARAAPVESPPKAEGYLLSLDAPKQAGLLQDPQIAHELLDFEGLRRDIAPASLAQILRYIPGKRDTMLTQVLTRMQPHAANMSSLLQQATGELAIVIPGTVTQPQPTEEKEDVGEAEAVALSKEESEKSRSAMRASLLGEALALAALDRSGSLRDELHAQLAAQLCSNPKPKQCIRACLVALRLGGPSKPFARCLLRLLERLERESRVQISKELSVLVSECREFLENGQSEAGSMVLADPRLRQQVVSEVLSGESVVLRVLLGNGKGVKLSVKPLTSFRNLLVELDDHVVELGLVQHETSEGEPAGEGVDYRWHGMAFFCSNSSAAGTERVEWTRDAHWWRWQTLLDLCKQDRLTHGAAQAQLQLELRAFVSPQLDYFKSQDPVRVDLLFAHAYRMLLDGELGTVRPAPLGYLCGWVAAIKQHSSLLTLTHAGFLECALEYLPRPLARRYAAMLNARSRNKSAWVRAFLNAAKVVWEAYKPAEVALMELKRGFVHYIALWPLGLGITFKEVRYDKRKPAGRLVINKNGVFVLASASSRSRDGEDGLPGLVVPWHAPLTELKESGHQPRRRARLRACKDGRC